MTDNWYFNLDLTLPKISKTDKFESSIYESSTSTTLHKFGFVQMLEQVHGKDLRTDNRWLNPKAKRIALKKQVRFATTEIVGIELPYCMKNCVTSKPGQLHSTSCKNSTQEVIDVLGQNRWQNRIFILECLMEKLHMQN